MPKLIPQTFYFGAPSVIYARINSPNQSFPACIGSVDDGISIFLRLFLRISRKRPFETRLKLVFQGYFLPRQVTDIKVGFLEVRRKRRSKALMRITEVAAGEG